MAPEPTCLALGNESSCWTHREELKGQEGNVGLASIASATAPLLCREVILLPTTKQEKNEPACTRVSLR